MALALTFALDYSFEAPETITGGLVEFSFTNRGKEPHFFGLARIPEGKSFDEVKGALTAAPPAEGPPPGPPPFEDFAGIATGDAGVSGKASLNIPAGSYVFYCLIPSPDGVSHANKGIVKQMNVSEGSEGALAEADSERTFVATDFAFDKNFSAEAGDNVFRLRNDGRQLHEINLVEMAPDKTMDDLLAWHRQSQGPPPARFLGGVAIKPEEGDNHDSRDSRRPEVRLHLRHPGRAGRLRAVCRKRHAHSGGHGFVSTNPSRIALLVS